MKFDLRSIWQDGGLDHLPPGMSLELHNTTRRDIGTLAGHHSFDNGQWHNHDTDNPFDPNRPPESLDEWVLCVEDALVTADQHVYASDGTLLSGSNWSTKSDVEHDIDQLGSHAPHVEGTVIFGDMPVGHIYGHWLLHVMPRVVRLRQLFGDLPTIVPRASWNNIPHWDLAGLPLQKTLNIPPLNASGGIGALRVERLLMTNQITLGTTISAERYDHVLEQFDFASSTAGSPERLFVARKPGHFTRRRGMSNSDDVAEIMREFGFTVFFPEDHSWKDQISHFRGARVVVGETGSNMNTAIFGGPNLAVVDISPLVDLSTREWQRGIAQYRGQHYGIIQGEREAMQAGWVADLDAVRAALGSMDFVSLG